MERRIDYAKASPEAYKAMQELNAYAKRSGLPAGLLELVKMRVSQINGCAYCLDMHSKIARARGETEQRLYGLDAWREAPYYTEQERAALEWAEAVTNIAWNRVPDGTYDEARQQFSEKELVDLTLAVIVINGWNRLAISFRSPAGTYKASPG